MAEEDLKFVWELSKAGTKTKNIAEFLSERTGKDFNVQDIHNIVNGANKDGTINEPSVEESVAKIRESGGDVRYKKADNTNDVELKREEGNQRGKKTNLNYLLIWTFLNNY